MQYLATVICKRNEVSVRRMHPDDRAVPGVNQITFEALTEADRLTLEELALDKFHATVPIKRLESFLIHVRAIEVVPT
jgi:hypothetical protein